MDEIRNMGASVRARLLNKARAEGRNFQELLQYFVMERFLYRLAESNLRDSFLLKGALLLHAKLSLMGRATRDVDFLGKIVNDPREIEAAIRRVCEQQVAEDGVIFDTNSIQAQRIVVQDEYSGVRVEFSAHVENAVLPLRVDIGIGDEVYPYPTSIEYPSLLGFPCPNLRCYPLTTVVAEKLEAMLSLGLANTRLKDYFDLLVISRQHEFSGEELAEAVRRTCRRRQTEISIDPAGLSTDFGRERMNDWKGFMNRSGLTQEGNWPDLDGLLHELRSFLLPLLAAAVASDHWGTQWHHSRWHSSDS